jgi:NADPH:quinone reductase-like Zn-dependent oxidoreductase
MRAAVLNSFDGPGAVTVAEVDDPMVTDGHVLVRIEAAAVGPWDPQTTWGAFTAVGGMSTFPQVLGWDFCERSSNPAARDHRKRQQVG